MQCNTSHFLARSYCVCGCVLVCVHVCVCILGLIQNEWWITQVQEIQSYGGIIDTHVFDSAVKTLYTSAAQRNKILPWFDQQMPSSVLLKEKSLILG